MKFEEVIENFWQTVHVLPNFSRKRWEILLAKLCCAISSNKIIKFISYVSLSFKAEKYLRK